MKTIPHSDFRILALEQYGDELAEASAALKATEDHLVSALQDARSYRDMAIELLDTVADLTRRNARLMGQVRQRLGMKGGRDE